MVLILGFVHPVFAQTSPDTSFLDGLSGLLTKIIGIWSRAWIPLATLAGKFMSNDMVYGSRFHLDNYLWQMWNISKNFANFGLLWLLLYKIFGFITGKEKDVKNIIGKAVIAGILIQMSWFLVWAVADLSAIATTALGSFPSSILSSTDAGSKMDNMIETNIRKWVITIGADSKPSRDTINVSNDQKSTADIKNLLMPKYDSVGGPLIFIGASALHIQDMMWSSSDQQKDAKSQIITFWLKWIILLLYIIILALLLIANVIRVWYLWVFIAISPIIILMSTFFKSDQWLWGKWFLKSLSLNNFIAIIFKPVIFVGIMGLILIFITSIQSMLTGSEINGTSMTQTAAGTTLNIEWVAKVSTNEVLNQTASTGQNIISDLIVYLATLFLLRTLIKVALTSGSDSDPIKWMMNKWTDFIEHAAKTTPIWTKWLSFSSSQKLRTDTLNNVGVPLWFENLGDFKSANFGKIENKEFDEKMRRFTGWEIARSVRELESLQRVAKKWEDFLGKTREIINTEGHEWFSSNASFYTEWEKAFKEWLTKSNKWITGLTQEYKDIKDLSDIKDKRDWETIHNALGWKKWEEPNSYEEFKKVEYKKTE